MALQLNQKEFQSSSWSLLPNTSIINNTRGHIQCSDGGSLGWSSQRFLVSFKALMFLPIEIPTIMWPNRSNFLSRASDRGREIYPTLEEVCRRQMLIPIFIWFDFITLKHVCQIVWCDPWFLLLNIYIDIMPSFFFILTIFLVQSLLQTTNMPVAFFCFLLLLDKCPCGLPHLF